MPYHDFDAEIAAFSRETQREPYRFRLSGHNFEALTEPLFGDVMELYRAPEPEVNEDAAVFAITGFIRRLLAPEDRRRFDEAVAVIPASTAAVILLKLGTEIAEWFTAPFLPRAPDSLPGRRQSSGTRSRRNGVTKKAS